MNQRQTNKNKLIILEDRLNNLYDELDSTEKNLNILVPKLKDAKKEWKNFQPQFEAGMDNLDNLQSQLHKAENDLVTFQSELNDDEILDLKFIIKKLKKKEIPLAKEELSVLGKKDEKLRIKADKIQEKIISLKENKLELEEEIDVKEKQIERIKQDEEYRKDRLFKKLYVDFDDDILCKVFKHFNLNEPDDEDNLKLLVDKFSEEKIYDLIKPIQKEEKRKEELIKKLTLEFDDNILSKVFKHFYLRKSSNEDNIKLLVDRYSEEEIYGVIISIQKEEKRKEELMKKLTLEFDDVVLSKVFHNLNIKKSSDNDNLKLLVDKYSEKQIYNFIKPYQEEYQKDKLFKKLYANFDGDMFRKVFKHFNLHESSDKDNLKLLVDRYSEEEINKFIGLENRRNIYLKRLTESEEEFDNFIKNHIDELCEIYPVSKNSHILVERLKDFLIKDGSVEEVVESIKFKTQKTKSDDDLSERFNKWCDNCFTYISWDNDYCPHCGSTNIFIKHNKKHLY